MSQVDHSARERQPANPESGEQEMQGVSKTPPPFQLMASADPNSGSGDGGNDSNSGGGGLPKPIQQKMESAMGADFSDVKIHENSSQASPQERSPMPRARMYILLRGNSRRIPHKGRS
jgi:hypothetical protein